jgi:uncharacterized protein (TIGR02453 family)
MKKIYFQPSFFKFLRDLKKNNNRLWFNANKERYELEVRNPLLDFIGEAGPDLRKISKNVVADNSPTGGSMFRIYRDTRFSKDKTPYKTAASAQFRHTQGKDVHAPGFYLHLEPGEVFVGGGIWHPEPPTLAQIRDSIASHPAKWKAVLQERTFKKRFKLDGDSLVRPPKGYDPAHPFIEDLKRKDFFVSAQFSEKDACSDHFMELFVKACQDADPLIEFLTASMNLPW